MKLKILLISIVLSISACTSKYLVYAQDSSLGIDLHAAPTEGNIRFAVGYDRTSFALVPKLEDGSDAMSMTGLNRVSVKGIDEYQFAHALATGDAAQSLVDHPEELKKLAKKVFVDAPADTTQSQGEEE